jgi:hypothetical protein
VITLAQAHALLQWARWQGLTCRESRGELRSQCVRGKLQMPNNTKNIHKKDVVEQRVKNVQNLAIDPVLLLRLECKRLIGGLFL